jgi:iron uptake system EfeUOB component EfeO/EfeM
MKTNDRYLELQKQASEKIIELLQDFLNDHDQKLKTNLRCGNRDCDCTLYEFDTDEEYFEFRRVFNQIINQLNSQYANLFS